MKRKNIILNKKKSLIKNVTVAEKQKSSKKLIGRFFFGAVFIVLALWIIIGEQITGASSSAYVNAQTSTIRSPIDGIITTTLSSGGVRLSKGEIIATINDPLFHEHVDDLIIQETNKLSEIRSLNQILKNINLEITTLETFYNQYQASAMIKINIAIAGLEERIKLLSGDGTVQNKIELSLARETLKINQQILRGLNDKTFLGGGNDILYQLKIKILDRKIYLSDTITKLSLSEDTLSSLKFQIKKEKDKLLKQSNAIIKNKSNTSVLEVLVSDGEAVVKGQDLYKLVLCNTAMVTLSVDGNVYNRLEVDQYAKFYLDNKDKIYEGKVARLSGARSSAIYKGLAIKPSLKNEDRFDVMLHSPELNKDFQSSCKLGVTGRVFFDHRPLDWFRQLLD